MFLLLIFLTGAATLALELLASRVMTPYFGVSLYIWSGILSITLVALALGYYLGGRLTGRDQEQPAAAFLFLLMPALSAISIVAACALYPKVFASLAQANLVLGCFAACALLICLPLIALSAMNPLLVAIQRRGGDLVARQGDSGSGRVFFVSTVGSVIGVVLTAFVFIPTFTNFNSLLIVAGLLAILALVGAVHTNGLAASQRRWLLAIASSGLLLAAGMYLLSPGYLGKDREILFDDLAWRLEGEYSSIFGNTKIVSISQPGLRARDPREELRLRVFLNDGTVQNIVDSNGVSRTPFTYALEFLALGLHEDTQSALVLGLAAGVIPMRLADQGLQVDVVEINPDAPRAAREFFDFDASRVNVIEADARVYVHACPRIYDVALVDLFKGDGTPDYLLSREFFRDIEHCLTPDGLLVLNSWMNVDHQDAYFHVVKTLKAVFPRVLMFHQDVVPAVPGLNVFLVASKSGRLAQFSTELAELPNDMRQALRQVLARPRPLSPTLLAHAEVLEDNYNVFPFINSATELKYRQAALRRFPKEYLVN